jgi:biotin--protein ligase
MQQGAIFVAAATGMAAISIRRRSAQLNCKKTIYCFPDLKSLGNVEAKLSEAGRRIGEKPFKTLALTQDIAENDTTRFDVLGAFQKSLKTSKLGRTGLYCSTLPSTQTLLRETFNSERTGMVCIVDRQSKGLGRGGNTWESPHGCCMFSLKCQEISGQRLPFVQYMISLAVVRAIKGLPGGAGIDVAIKWPNDIYVNKELKVGGVLCQSTYQQNVFDLTIGVGINTTNDEPTVSLNSVRTPGSPPITREELLAGILNHFESMMNVFYTDGFSVFAKAYTESWMHSNQKVQVVLKDGTDPIAVTIKGIAEASGGLYAIDDHGNPYELYPDGNSFDFFKGLIRRKL